MIFRGDRLDEAAGEYVRRYARRARVDMCTTLATQMSLAVEQVSGVDHAGVTLVTDEGSIRCLAATDGHPVVLDNIQRRCRQGPCLDAAVNRRTFRINDLASEVRWPEFVREALACTPVRAVLAFPVFEDGGTRAALNLYADRPRSLDTDAEVAGALIAPRITETLTTGQSGDEPARSADTDVVGEAMQLLMRRFSIDVAQSFAMMVKLAKRQHVSIEAVARALVPNER